METGYYTTFMSLRANESERGNPAGFSNIHLLLTYFRPININLQNRKKIFSHAFQCIK